MVPRLYYLAFFSQHSLTPWIDHSRQVCSDQCEKASLHAEGECPIFAAQNIKFQSPEDAMAPNPQYECITALRLLQLREKDRTKWEEVMEMESHCDKRKTNEEFWNAEGVNTVEFIRNRCKMERWVSFSDIFSVGIRLVLNSPGQITLWLPGLK